MQTIDPIAPVEGPEEQPPLEVALLTWEYPPIPTAKGRVACEVAHALAHHGANVRVFTMDRDDRVETDHERIQVIGCAGRITGLRRLMRRTPGLEHIVAAAAFREAVHEEHDDHPFDIIETTNWRAPAAMLMKCGLPIVVRNSTPSELDAEGGRSLAERFSRRIASGLEARCAQRADAVISNTRSHAGAVARWYDLTPGHIHMVTPLSVDPELRKAGTKCPYPPAHARLRLAYIGDESARKGFEEVLLGFDAVIEHARRTGEALPELHLVGLRPGVLDETLEHLDLAADTCEQLFDYGRLTDANLGHVITRCHGILAPSRYQSNGSIYHEAAALGRPLVACAEDPTARNFIEAHGCGVLAETCSPKHIAEAVIGLFSDRRRLLAMRQNGLTAAKAWTRDTLGARTLQVYRRAMRLTPIEIPEKRPVTSRSGLYDHRNA